MNEKQTTVNPLNSKLGGVGGLRGFLVAIFPHKWTILFIGLVAALLAGLCVPRYFESQAKLLVKYVAEAKAPVLIGAGSGVHNVDEGEVAINTELEILTSFDLAKDAAALLRGSTNDTRINDLYRRTYALLADGKTNDVETSIASVIQGGLRPDLPKRGKVIVVDFRHSNPQVVRPVLECVIEAYIKKHEETHRTKRELTDSLRIQLDQMKARLAAAEEQLNRAKTSIGVASLDESKRLDYDQMSKILQARSEGEADLAGRRTALSVLEAKASDSNPQRKLDIEAEQARIAGMESRIRKFNEQLDALKKEVHAIEAVENTITALEREKKLAEDEYMRMAAGVQQVKLDAELNVGKAYNISIIQKPSPATNVAIAGAARIQIGSIAAILAALCFAAADWLRRRPLASLASGNAAEAASLASSKLTTSPR